MKLFNKTLILAAIGALLVFSAGCTAKARRPVPSDTDIIGGASTTDNSTSTVFNSTSTNSNPPSAYSGSGYTSGGSAGSFGGGTFGNQSVFTPAATNAATNAAPQDTISTRTDEGIRDGDKIRNIPSLQPIYFDFDRYAIKDSERGKVQALKDYLAKNPAQKALIEGYCDWRGTAEYNMALGDRRANAVKRYAISIGIPANKIQTLSLGSTQAVENGTDSQMAKDRRGEIVILVK